MAQDFLQERMDMVARQLHRRGILDARVLTAFGAVPRHWFVPEEFRDQAYEDCPLPIGHGQTISQPFIVAYMLQMLDLNGTERVLEVGTGSGYAAALLAHLAREVHTVELEAVLAERARGVLSALHAGNVFVHMGDGSLGWMESAPYEAILVSAAATDVPQSLLEQLTDPGRMILPVGGRGGQHLELWRRSADAFACESLLPVAFVPLRGGSDRGSIEVR
ncbi:MAG: protein-L-isoaspartate(D-aspartate) O-methyltransferase [Chloroflexi bacterium]|nr:protein-L-isoaspartate(D-aspartate) O-methyltransferase [Chloroflexota bacterium]